MSDKKETGVTRQGRRQGRGDRGDETRQKKQSDKQA